MFHLYKYNVYYFDFDFFQFIKQVLVSGLFISGDTLNLHLDYNKSPTLLFYYTRERSNSSWIFMFYQ